QNRPMLIIRFENNNNFVGRGGSKALTLVFENFSGNGMTGTLELVLPRGITASNARSSHGAPSFFQEIAKAMTDFAKRVSAPTQAQQTTPASNNGVRLNFGQVANGEQVTLDLDATVAPTYTQATALVQARLIVNGQVVDTATALLVVDNNIVALPATGETPAWRDALIIGLLGLATLGLTFVVWRKRATA
ncbi:MAG: hypothetical protein KJ043_06560, partial [Anaerolineae bacterium]|nr:hypothetical protein [Anaerolineae bacterium]